MQRDTIVRAWKDPLFRSGLSEQERAAIPANPAGPAFVDLPESELVNWTFAVTCVWLAADEHSTANGLKRFSGT